MTVIPIPLPRVVSLPRVVLLIACLLSMSATAADYVEDQSCADCHSAQQQTWQGSHHQLAMQAATPETVLGDFNDAAFEHFGTRTRFFRDGERYMVRTDGPDGTPADFEIRYTFGITPLQQYLIEFPDGRLQALSIAWDVNEQRWFHLYDEPIAHGDELHWTGPNQNWNFMCADCHSTDLRKGYDAEADRYDTRWSEINVGCQACHGPGSAHAAWVSGGKQGADPYARESASLDAAHAHAQVEACGRCHARRASLRERPLLDEPLLQSYVPALLEPGLYHADGQILDEVYVYGSFLQSRMYAAGVRCTDCHDAHSAKLKAEGNDICVQCHNKTPPARFDGLRAHEYDTPDHHFHAQGSEGAQCVNCHMPERTYMVIDPRRDHSLRIPRPDLSVSLDTPNACNQCHQDESAQWAAAVIREHTGRDPAPHYAQALAAARNGSSDASTLLRRLAVDPSQAAIVRASALKALADLPGTDSLAAATRGLRDAQALVRLGAVQSLEGYAPEQRVRLLPPLLDDPVLAVRIEAARLLAVVPATAFAADERARRDEVLQEYIAAQQVNADRAESHVNLGNLQRDLGALQEAEKAYNKALAVNPKAIAAYVNLADLQRARGRELQAEQTLRVALRHSPDAAALHHALGLSLVRQQKLKSALSSLRKAAGLAPQSAHYAYVYGVALHSGGAYAQAVAALEESLQRHPTHRDTRLALISFARDRQDHPRALKHAEILLQQEPGNTQLGGLVEQLRSLR